jgi:hypothetical protein
MVASRLDKRVYDVLEQFDDKAMAADVLARINIDIAKLIKDMKSRDAPHTYSKKQRDMRNKMIDRISTRYNPDALRENAPRGSNDTSYTENKGKSVAICLREKKTGRQSIHDYNTIMFVVLHELAHIGTEQYGHGADFWKTFRLVLDEAIRSNLYKSINYRTNPINYCGLQVTYNPLYDKTLF